MFWKRGGIRLCQVSLFIPVLWILTPVCSHARKSGVAGPRSAHHAARDHLLLLYAPVRSISRITFSKSTGMAHADRYLCFAVTSGQPRAPRGRTSRRV